MRLGVYWCWIALALSANCWGQRMSPEKLWELARVGDAVVSPDGSQVAFLVTRYDLAKNEGTSSLYIQPLPKSFPSDNAPRAIAFNSPLLAAPVRELMTGVKGLGSLAWLNHASGPKLVYIAPAKIAAADDTGAKTGAATEKESAPSEEKPQVWMLEPSGGEPTQMTHVPEGVANLRVSPSGDALAFTVDVKMDPTVSELYADLPKADARIIDSLMYRHWNQWHDYAYSHVHVVSIDPTGKPSAPRDLMASLKADCPMPPFGGAEQFAFSPDGKELALTLKLVNNPAESTDSSIHLASIDGGTLKNITPGMPGYDTNPVYSADGRFLAFQSMLRGGFESDRNRIMIYNRTSGELSELTQGLEQTTNHAVWSLDSNAMFFDSETRGTQQVFRLGVDGEGLQQISSGHFDFNVVEPVPSTVERPESKWLLIRQQNILRPTELALLDVSTKQLVTITDVNGELYKTLELPTVQERWVTASDGQLIHNWLILPPGFEAGSDDSSTGKQWPMLTYCQGGPQSQIGQSFSYRWNFHTMAAQGYVVLAVNRRGLPGFGQEWNDQISGDWGGQAMQDILASTDAMMADPRIDRERVAAIGASFGGYTVYWLMGNADDRFCAMISHCGVFNLESMYGSTEELFFVNWDMGGPYWKSPEIAQEYQQFSPHRFVGNWKTPLLVIHGEKDFRVPVTQGMEAFSAAQVQGVPSRFLYFPEEGHWVTSPQNSVLWGRVFFDWLDRHCGKP